MDANAVEDINLLATFLANEQAPSLESLNRVDCIVLCGSAILQCAESVFKALQANPFLAQTLVICGGIGHSTQSLYDAVKEHETYKSISAEVQRLPESRVLYCIFQRFYGADAVQDAGCKIIIEDKSTNCGANAIETVNLLAHFSIVPKTLAIVQDPTMSIRTLASFRKAYVTDPVPRFITLPSFTPTLIWEKSRMQYDLPNMDTSGLWRMDRLCDLLLGEIPRLRDDKDGYGPAGKGFISHVEIPESVLLAWHRLKAIISTQRVKELTT